MMRKAVLLKLSTTYSKRALRLSGPLVLATLVLQLPAYALTSFNTGEIFNPDKPFSGTALTSGPFSGTGSSGGPFAIGGNGGGGTDNDLDGDGVIDSLDNCVSISNASQADFDNDDLGDACDSDDDSDGLSDVDEASIGTNPFNSDSDGDGFTDGNEVMAGTNPLNNFDNIDANAAEVPMAPHGLLAVLFACLTLIQRYRQRAKGIA